MNCPACGFENPAGFKFCGSCGGALAVSAPAAPSIRVRQPAEERRTVTILFADVAGFTAMSERLDPEDVQEIMSGVFQRVGAAIGGYGGTIDKYIGDAIMALFGAPVALGDDAERAVRAGLAIQRQIAEFSTEVMRTRGFELKVRIGINTGKVVWGRAAEAQEFTVVGDAVNLAARVQTAAPIGTVLLGEATQRHVRNRFALEPLPPVAMKGKSEPQRVYRVIGEIGGGAKNTMTGAKVPLVGRDEEIAILTTALAGLASGHGSVITIQAPQGQGKSRLLRELRSDAEDEAFTILPGRAPPFGNGAPWAPWTDLLQRASRLEGLAPADARRKLSEWLVTTSGGAEIDTRAFHELANVADLDDPEVLRRREQPGRFRQALKEGLLAWLEASSRLRPAVMLVEDLHWWPSPSLELLATAAAAARSAPMMVVATRRPDPLPDPWPPQADDRVIDLAPLDRAALLSLAHGVLGQNVPPGLVLRLESVSLGNPLFAEEIIQIYIDRGALTPSADRTHWTWNERLAETAGLPTSVEGVTQARIDALPPLEKALLQNAAVAGRSFWEGQLSETPRADTAAALQRLLAREFIQSRRSRIAGQSEWEFKHAVIQTVAYENTLKKERLLTHRRIATWLEIHVGARLEFAGEIAEHHRRGEEPAKALRWLIVAAEEAVRAFAKLDEARVVEEAVVVATQVGDPASLATALRLRGRLRRIAGHPDAESDLRLAMDGAARLNDTKGAALAGVELAGFLHQRSDFAKAAKVAGDTLAFAESSNSLRSKTQALNMLGVLAQTNGDHETADRLYGEALAAARAMQDSALEGFILLTIGNFQLATDRFPAAVTSLEQALGKEISRENEAFSRSNLGAAYLGMKKIDSAKLALDSALDLAERIGSRIIYCEARIRRGAASAAAGDLVGGIREIDEGCALARNIGASEPLTEGLLRKGTLLSKTDANGARELLDEGLSIAVRDGNGELRAKIETALAALP